MHYKRQDGAIAERSGERLVILDHSGTTVITLNPVGAIVWDRLPADIEAIVQGLHVRFPDVATQTLREDALAFLDQLRFHSLVDTDATS